MLAEIEIGTGTTVEANSMLAAFSNNSDPEVAINAEKFSSAFENEIGTGTVEANSLLTENEIGTGTVEANAEKNSSAFPPPAQL